MLPVILRIPLPGGNELPLHSFGLLIVVGFLLGTMVAAREARRVGLPEFMHDMGLVMLLAGLVGGRLYYYIENFDEKYADASPWEFFKIWKGGLVFYGGAITGFLAALIYIRRRRLPMGLCLDVAALAAPIAMAFGRIGCYLNGCCFGRTCAANFPMAVVFPPESAAAEMHRSMGILSPGEPALPVHPVQLYQATHDFLLAGLLFWAWRRGWIPRGGGMPLIFVLYAIGRFIIEGLRGDEATTFTGLTVGQNDSVLLFVVFGAALCLSLVRSGKGLTAA